MRDAQPQLHAQGALLDRWYARAAAEQLDAAARRRAQDETPPELLQDAEHAQGDGRRKFRDKNFYAAANAFQRSLEAVLKHQQSEYYGDVVAPADWDDEALQQRYVTLCNNVAICGLKMQDLSLVSEYAGKALAVDQASSKALYAMAKLRLLEHRYAEAREVLRTALTFHPDKSQYVNLRKEIEAAERMHVLEQAELAEVRAKQVQAAQAARAENPEAPLEMTAEEREEQFKQNLQQRRDATPLPTREDDLFAAARLNVYFMKIKQRMMADIQPRYNADAGEEPLFECTIVNGTTGEVLAAGVQGVSKKIVKNEACKIAIEKLWQDKQAAGKLTPEDLTYLERFEHAKASGHSLTSEPAVQAAPQKAPDSSPQLPTRLSWLERQLQPLPLLNQLSQRGILQARFDMEDVSPDKEVTEFKCTGFLNGEQIAAANAISKKKARAEVASKVLAAAFEKKLVIVYDTPADENEDGTKDQDEGEQTPAHGG
ncbi:unnamed protein product [Phytophthora fragariaefolia]|uniref:Unnamed protein product n=1 Tax=Phytophthora fragariaefolia TaxID=1490495 RepID=A0A9W6XVT3_9STRA|nr:unnamed protein product [Phytophthora fragariaefolia]